MVMKSTSSILISFYLIFGSAEGQQPTFWIHNQKAKMPVVVRGNIQSHALIVFLHGGPGGTALKKIGTRAFSKLEEDFGVVYWDQRGADKSRGGAGKALLNLDQFIDDLDALINHLQTLYPMCSVFLMGHCWGSTLATAYLADDERQQKINGWIIVGGAYNNPKGDSLSMVWVKNHARERIAKGVKTRYWKKALKWYAKNPGFSSGQLKHYSFVGKANGYQYVKGDSLGLYPGYTPKDILRNPGQGVAYYLNYYRTLTTFIISEIDLSGQLEKIKIPMLIVWGMEDGIMPVTLALDAFALSGADPEDKFMVLFDQVAHTVFYEHPTQFAHNTGRFIKRYMPLPENLATRNWAVFDKSLSK
jgi:proline iminopeptidase